MNGLHVKSKYQFHSPETNFLFAALLFCRSAAVVTSSSRFELLLQLLLLLPACVILFGCCRCPRDDVTASSLRSTGALFAVARAACASGNRVRLASGLTRCDAVTSSRHRVMTSQTLLEDGVSNTTGCCCCMGLKQVREAGCSHL